MTLILAVDTASPRFAVAAVSHGRLLSGRVHDEPQAHSRALLKAIAETIAEVGRRPDRLAAVVGPGSYAGLRVGLATVQGLALGTGIPVSGVGTLPAVALASGLRRVAAIHAIGRGDFAVQEFNDGRALGPIELAAPEDLPATIAGEGAGELHGTEVSPGERCAAAARFAAALPEPHGSELDAIYVREPSISRPRRAGAAAHTEYGSRD